MWVYLRKGMGNVSSESSVLPELSKRLVFLSTVRSRYILSTCWVSFSCLHEDFKMLLNKFCILSVHKRRLLMETGRFVVAWCDSKVVLLLAAMSWSYIFKTFREPWILENFILSFSVTDATPHLSLNSNSTWLDQQVSFLIFLKEK